VGCVVLLGGSVIESFAHDPSFEIAAEQYVYGRASWMASLAPDGRLIVKLGRDSRRLVVAKSRMRELEALLTREHFFDLAETYGEADVHDFRSITVKLGGKSKRVVIYGAIGRETRTDELSRALRVAVAVRGLFDWPAALDSRKDDEAVLHRLSKNQSALH
jgi:hypothetical protein